MLYKFDCDYDYDLQISVATWNSKCTKKIYFLINPWSHFNRLYHSLRQSFGNISSACKLQYLKSKSWILDDIVYANENCVTQLQNDGAVVVGHMRQSMGPCRNWYHRCPIRRNQCIALCMEGGTINANQLQLQRQQTCWLLCAYCLTILMHCGRRCRQWLCATAGDSRVVPAVHCLSQSTDFLFCFFYGHFSTEKRKETKMRMSFSAEK